jgi:alpha-galactosidase/6-phospho-beta-glucosidase family protein
MPKAVKIGVIGAGSAQFSLGLVRDLILTESLHGSTVCFMDVDAERLDLVYRLAQRYVNELGVELYFERSPERQAVLADADFVINTALVGGHYAEEAERTLSDLPWCARNSYAAPVTHDALCRTGYGAGLPTCLADPVQ